jgi:hypothetical protein
MLHEALLVSRLLPALLATSSSIDLQWRLQRFVLLSNVKARGQNDRDSFNLFRTHGVVLPTRFPPFPRSLQLVF